MPQNFELLQEGRGVIVTYSGDIAAADLRRMLSNPAVSDLVKSLKYMLFDFSKVDSLSLTMSDVDQLSEAAKTLATSGQQRRFIAFVAPQDLVFGQAPQMEALSRVTRRNETA